MQEIKNFSLEELEKVLESWGEPKFRAKQILFWVYQRGINDFSAMSDLSVSLRKRLKDNFSLSSLKLVKAFKSSDATEKFLFQLKDGNLIEAVSIPAQKRVTACISSQAGCKFACSFCASGLLGFKRNLSCAEMLDEVLFLKNNTTERKLTHIVFMGTGEPLDNYENVIKAIRLINAKEALQIGARRITISTCGLIPGIKRLAQEGLQVELSISLHAADDKTRSLLLPVNQKYPLKDLIAACSEYIKKTGRQITFEYVLIEGVNSRLQNAQNLSRILKGLRLAKVNLIAANTICELKTEPPPKTEVLKFKDYLLKEGINATLRRARGEDIEAACGQLRLRHEKN